ncbi:UDP-N-acetylglucosamine--N-acetylmuramyl-(pentapeptide) pyrophosphoryl-undecaprenol N-acetylglucosamine transferase [Helicobacter trogontum]|uniref:UDP-N-acetylglucosamine--N-acetylmuramyl- (pentapeptide) pyrophosphoryl-undecaprenol N-acetylglucosamine transferase n=1 Tax=Helicobacter trogontum TaxID=50960 RepID=UPI002A91FB3D|nr:UDP-N-acetylglucosamine--N-acetylmuramyl-(pentapeptide) pyrophosphoryl-undecaprenol N-acetylglucosamine transferase [Helicobacter trogontum]MDY5186081.1 UDP-N-acetylglucosamine--N-acetylmuramyl-(pentapeptide) pyrophosphoryl-undecaprenol N-acetylglucosamine transferase [Helicobacter trogontum]
MNIAITGGGTGGHLAIARALGEECKKQGITTLYIGGTKGQDKQWFDNAHTPFTHVAFLDSTPVVNQGFLGKWSALAKNITESLKAKKLLKEHNINACISVGGFSAATGSFGAIFSRIPFFIHEQNACMGSLNKLLKPFAKSFFSSFEYPNVTLAPYPINSDFFIKQRERDTLKTIAFFGGSQGAKAINELALNLAPLLKEKNIKILHQAGKIDYENTYKAYVEKGFNLADSMQDFKSGEKDIFVFDFSKDMAELMNMADFCISRAGASSLWELVSNGLPTLFIPYPHAAKNHQYFNAKSLIDQNLALLYTQEEILHLESNDLINTILQVNLSEISQSLMRMAQQDGAKCIIDNINQYFIQK